MSAQEFKPGDRVEYVGHPKSGYVSDYLIGKYGTVARQENLSSDSVPVKWDHRPLAVDGVLALNIRLISAEPEDKDDLYVEPEPLKEGDAVRALAQAIIWTREYVGEATLPAMKGWSWYDALREYAPEFLPEEPTQCTSLYEYEEGKYVRCCRASGHANPGHQGYGKGWLAESARLADGGAS